MIWFSWQIVVRYRAFQWINYLNLYFYDNQRPISCHKLLEPLDFVTIKSICNIELVRPTMICRLCNKVEETPIHLLCNWMALEANRFQLNLCIVSFIDSSKFLKELYIKMGLLSIWRDMVTKSNYCSLVRLQTKGLRKN